MTTLGFAWFVSGFSAAFATIEIGYYHDYGWGAFNLIFAGAAALIAWRELA